MLYQCSHHVHAVKPRANVLVDARVRFLRTKELVILLYVAVSRFEGVCLINTMASGRKERIYI